MVLVKSSIKSSYQAWWNTWVIDFTNEMTIEIVAQKPKT